MGIPPDSRKTPRDDYYDLYFNIWSNRGEGEEKERLLDDCIKEFLDDVKGIQEEKEIGL